MSPTAADHPARGGPPPGHAGGHWHCPEKEQIFTELIMDGRVLGENLHRMGVDETWLLRQLRQQGCHSARGVSSPWLDANKQVAVYPVST